MAAIFGETTIFGNWDSYSAEIPCGSKFRQYRSISHGFRDISIFVSCNLCGKFENSKWPPFLARQKFFENWDGYFARISIFVFCNFCEKFENLKWPPFLERQKFFENWDGYFADISIFVFCNFCEKFENLKWPPFLAR